MMMNVEYLKQVIPLQERIADKYRSRSVKTLSGGGYVPSFAVLLWLLLCLHSAADRGLLVSTTAMMMVASIYYFGSLDWWLDRKGRHLSLVLIDQLSAADIASSVTRTLRYRLIMLSFCCVPLLVLSNYLEPDRVRSYVVTVILFSNYVLLISCMWRPFPRQLALLRGWSIADLRDQKVEENRARLSDQEWYFQHWYVASVMLQRFFVPLKIIQKSKNSKEANDGLRRWSAFPVAKIMQVDMQELNFRIALRFQLTFVAMAVLGSVVGIFSVWMGVTTGRLVLSGVGADFSLIDAALYVLSLSTTVGFGLMVPVNDAAKLAAVMSFMSSTVAALGVLTFFNNTIQNAAASAFSGVREVEAAIDQELKRLNSVVACGVFTPEDFEVTLSMYCDIEEAVEIVRQFPPWTVAGRRVDESASTTLD